MKENNILINGGIFFDQPVKNELRTSDNTGKITTAQRDD